MPHCAGRNDPASNAGQFWFTGVKRKWEERSDACVITISCSINVCINVTGFSFFKERKLSELCFVYMYIYIYACVLFLNFEFHFAYFIALVFLYSLKINISYRRVEMN